jgi:hypothetical protein
MKKITTKSGSVYLLDEEAKTVHRVEGKDHYKGRCTTEPAKYHVLGYPPTVGMSLVAVWEEGSSKALVTNYVTSIEEVH